MPKSKTPKSKIIGILTETERDRLINYDSIDVIERKNLNFRLKKKLNIIKDALEDINLLLNSLSEDATKGYIDTETALCSLAATERILQLREPWPVVERDGKIPLVYMTKGERIKDRLGECTIESMAWTATDEEITINRRLKEHIAALQYYIDPYLINPGCLEPREQIVLAEEALSAMRNGTRRELTISTYFKDNIKEDGLNYPEFLTVREDDLKFKRWNPKGLPWKYDVPEQGEPPK